MGGAPGGKAAPGGSGGGGGAGEDGPPAGHEPGKKSIDRLRGKPLVLPPDPWVRVKQVLAGAGAGAFTKTAVAPLERIKVLFQLQGMQAGVPPKYTGIRHALARVYADEGVRGLYRGNGANVVRVVPVYALKFSFNDAFKDMLRAPGEKDLSALKMLLAGSMAGMFQTSVTYPLDMIRTRLSMAAVEHVQYKGIVDCGVQILRTEGLLAWYKGFGATILSATPYVGLQMTFYDLWKRVLFDWTGDNVPARVLCGALSGLAAQSITFPGDVIRRRMQVQGVGGAERLYNTTWQCIKGTYRNEGVPGFFKGLTVNAVRALPGAGIQFAAYDSLKKLLGV